MELILKVSQITMAIKGNYKRTICTVVFIRLLLRRCRDVED